MKDLYIGLMSGTSADGIDAALVDFSRPVPAVEATYYTPYAQELKNKILALCHRGENEIHRLGELDVLLGKEFASAVNHLLNKNSIRPQSIKAIGSHGQTVRHHPHPPFRFTLQIGDPNTIAAETGITTVADFRRKDIAHGGQGAPLVPAFHQHVFASAAVHRAIVNIGGIANATILKRNHPDVIGFDTGPGNVLMDAWIHLHHNQNHDTNGAWGAQGTLHTELLASLLKHDFFQLPPPKSTGREQFHLEWLNSQLRPFAKNIPAADVQTTLVELTARSIIESVQQQLSGGEILVCGGGTHNAFLMSRLRDLAAPRFIVDTTIKYGLDPDWIEATAFAWLARQTINRKTGNLPGATGASKAVILGGIYYGS
ncbi:Anhydro-N-acetylmuramic acid kinase [Aquicella siphonis]|uniref:Anhydro-N-acetylmuramic acid kinase n=1 Tax=Aquicella siphonis TaxID=254247 RepID=A0A5E4PF54_9COXI|nr:anhydro-N-acetylmuramic acid kinase [Aquicella siphonis]VVC75142.1 Anhydro-N-acetylmuramic acid kinase [Aquicella siphonis]